MIENGIITDGGAFKVFCLRSGGCQATLSSIKR